VTEIPKQIKSIKIQISNKSSSWWNKFEEVEIFFKWHVTGVAR
jgi:hypothetical protein